MAEDKTHAKHFHDNQSGKKPDHEQPDGEAVEKDLDMQDLDVLNHDATLDTSKAETSGDEPSDEPDTKDTKASADAPPDYTPEPVVSKNLDTRWGRFKQWCGRHKAVVSVVSLMIVLAVLAAVPMTRFKIAGLFLKQTAVVIVTDSQTNRPVSSAMIQLGNVTAKTDNKGQARLRVPVGSANLKISKAYYRTDATTTTVPILKPKTAIAIHLQATGRQVPVNVVNTITGKALGNITIKTNDTETKTDNKGQAIIVLPADKQTLSATISANGYNTKTVTITVTETPNAANNFQITPAGKIYLLSNRSGNIDVVKADLDGGNRQTVIAGTGKEDQSNTVLLATRDWKYLALYSKRDGGDSPKIFLISTATDTMSTIDEGDASFTLVGWSGHHFVYDVVRNSVPDYAANRQVIKSFDADSKAIATLDQNDSTGGPGAYTFQTFGSENLLDGQVVYVTGWDGNYGGGVGGKSITIRSVGVDGQGKKDVKSFDATKYSPYASVQAGANSIYYEFSLYNSTTREIYEYEDGGVKTADITQTQFNTAYPTYLQSPSGQQTFWSDVRDGKNSLFVGDPAGANAQEILSQTEQNAYGWYTDNYVLSAKSGSELYIMSAKGGQQIKITDYYKPVNTYRGYGGGYGGF